MLSGKQTCRYPAAQGYKPRFLSRIMVPHRHLLTGKFQRSKLNSFNAILSDHAIIKFHFILETTQETLNILLDVLNKHIPHQATLCIQTS